MTRRPWAALIIFVAILGIATGTAFAANGTLKGSFAYKDPATGTDKALTSGYIYLHSAVKPPPMEKFMSKADFIYTMGTAVPFSFSVPAGKYYIRILQRKAGSTAKAYGPPQEGDYTWIQQTPITITASTTLDLGKKYATLFSLAPIIISGSVKTATGTPIVGRYVRAQTEPCLAPANCTDSGCEQYGNQCGPAKYLALKTTDANGGYTLYLSDPGTYYIYASSCLMPGHNQNPDDNRCTFSAAPAPVTVDRGARVTVDVQVN